jgi:formylglycine-generating enzyme required for sulfatase activity
LPIEGLVPLGPDPVSGLEEFAHLQSGEVPQRDAQGRLAIGDGTAIVLVLVPGGPVVIGSQSTDANDAHYDPHRHELESDLHSSTVEPLLIGKYELTQGQVQALGVSLQALAAVGTPNFDGSTFTGRHPEESVQIPVVEQWLPHFELRLPTHDEWEVAARAGSPHVWVLGDTVESLQGFANIADATLIDTGHLERNPDGRVRDGWVSHAPVGTYAANAFGLHDVLGNVAELTVATVDSGATFYQARGGSFLLAPVDCRIGSLIHIMPSQTAPYVGLRVARSLPRS